MNFKGHRALITGASSGIGAAFAKQLAASGANLILVARRRDRLEALASQLRTQYSIEVSLITADLNQPHASQLVFAQATAEGGEVTLLINNAGVGRYGSFMDFPLEDHLSTLQINSTAPTEMTYLFVQHMLKHGKPSYIAQVASIAAFNPSAQFSVYCGSKGYLLYFTEALAFELKNTQIKLTCICPGGTYTEFFEQSGQKITAKGHKTMMTAEEVVRLSLRAMLQGKVIFIPGLINKLACFLRPFFPRKFAMRVAHGAMNQAVEQVAPKSLGV